MARLLAADHGLAVTRAAFGVYFGVQAYDKTQRHWLTDGKQLAHFLQPQLAHAQGWYRPFVEHTVLPHALLFSRLITVGEWAVGISLVLGLLTPLGALGGMWLVFNYMTMKGWTNIAGSVDRLFFVACLVFLVTGAGMVWGLDGLLFHGLGRGTREPRPVRQAGPGGRPMPQH